MRELFNKIYKVKIMNKNSIKNKILQSTIVAVMLAISSFSVSATSCYIHVRYSDYENRIADASGTCMLGDPSGKNLEFSYCRSISDPDGAFENTTNADGVQANISDDPDGNGKIITFKTRKGSSVTLHGCR